MGSEEILYGDKVIQTKNERRYEESIQEIMRRLELSGQSGARDVVGQYKTSKMNLASFEVPRWVEIQPGLELALYRSRFW